MDSLNKILVVFLLLCSAQLVAQKKALVITIGEYPSSSKWPSLSSANDLKYVENTLDYLGFEKEQIQMIADNQATKAGILEEFNKLIEDTGQGDLVYIHYSGHGQQVVDNNEDEIDKLDEAIVPFDSPLYFEEGIYEGQNLIRDDELQDLTNRLRKKIGPNGQVLLIMDSCHSGTGTRGLGKARGTNIIMGPSTSQTKPDKKENFGISNFSEKELSPMACLFGSSAQELNYETIDRNYNTVGSLTFAVSEVLTNLTGQCTFQELFEMVKNKMIHFAPKQNPKFEGPKDIILFGKGTTQFKNWINVSKQLSSSEIILETGTLNGVFPGSRFEILNLNNKKKLADAVVINAQLTSCLVKLKSKVISKKNRVLIAQLIEKSSPPCRVELNNQLDEKDEWNKVLNQMDQNEICSFSESAGDIYLSSCGDNKEIVQLATKEGDLIYEGKNPSKINFHSHKINQVLKEFALGKYLRQYDFKSETLNFDLEVVPVKVSKRGKRVVKQTEINPEEKRGEDGFLHFKNGDYIKIKVKNNGKVGAYFSVLDIQGDNKINFIIPSRGSKLTAEDFYLNPGESYETNFSIRIAPPFGTELIKLIASDKVLDIESSISVGKTRGKSQHPFEKLLSDIAVKTRSSKESINVSTLSTADFVFKIVE